MMARRERFIITIAVLFTVLGSGFRLWHLDGPTVSSDETVAAQHVAGYVEGDVLQAFAGMRALRAQDARQFVVPTKERSARTVALALAAEDPQHPPLFYVAERWWMEAAGSSVSSRRALPAMLGILGIGAAWWLCALVTQSAVGGWTGAAFFAISPLEVVYAQQVREYSLFATLTMSATALVIMTLRRPGLRALAAYAVASVAGMYTFSLFVLVLAAHVTMVLILRPSRATLLRVMSAIAVVVATWLPWGAVLVARRDLVSSTDDWSSSRWSPVALFAKWLYNAVSAAFDLFYLDVRWAPLAALVLCVLGLGLWELRKGPPEARVVVWSLLAWSFGVLAIVDLVAGGHRSTVASYVIPAYCALIVVLAAGVSANWTREGKRFVLCAASALLVCILGVTSLSVRASRAVWWDNAKEGHVRTIAAAIDGAHLPVLVTDVNWPLLISLTTYTRSNPLFILVSANQVAQVVASRPALVITTSNASTRTVLSNRLLRTEVPGDAAATVASAPYPAAFLSRPADASDADVDDSRAVVLRMASRAPRGRASQRRRRRDGGLTQGHRR